MKKIRHYKTYDNAFTRMWSEWLYSEEYRTEMFGYSWYNSGYYPYRHSPCTLEWDEFRCRWVIK